MKFRVLLFLYGFVTFSESRVLTNPSRLEIRGGENAKAGEFPYMVEVKEGNGCFICGGTIISPKWILTAGHCVDEAYAVEDGYSIVYGTTVLKDCFDNNPEPETSVIKVKTLYRHPQWTGVRIPTSDIGILELEEDIPLNEFAQPIALTDEDKNPSAGDLGNLTGWGSSVSGDYAITNLQKIQLNILSNEACSSRIDGYMAGVEFNGTQFLCTDDQDNGQCNGDSGGPFVIDGIQYGIVSWSLKPCGIFPGVFSRVALPEHRQWIREITGI